MAPVFFEDKKKEPALPRRGFLTGGRGDIFISGSQLSYKRLSVFYFRKIKAE